MFWSVAFSSLLHRRGSALLSIIAIAISVFTLVAIEHIRNEAKSSFAQTVSGVDLIVGARGGEINLLLYSVFYLGNASRNISYDSFESLQQASSVAWAIPLSMGDSHRGFRVIGTDENFFKHFKYGQKRPLEFLSGQPFSDEHQVVIGAAVARKLDYQLGQKITIAHGLGRQSFSKHEHHPFTINGILKPTGTPVDQAVYVSLGGLEAVHSAANSDVSHDHKPESITAAMVGLKSRLRTFQLQRQINQSQPEPLMAILPGVTLSQLWESMNMMENTLIVISWLILIAALTGLSATLLASMRERQQELLVLRSLGARPWFIFGLIQAESLLITLTACGLGMGVFYGALLSSGQLISSRFGINISHNFLTLDILITLAMIIAVSLLVSLYPGYKAYRLAIR